MLEHMPLDADAIIIGGGFYGAMVACYLASERGLASVILIEREPRLMQRASFANQARVHNGYHYPRSFTTAYRSRVNLPRFMQEWDSAVRSDFLKIYAIARRNSKVTATQFVRFCETIDAPLTPAPASVASLFNPNLIEQAFVAKEYGFDSERMRQMLVARLSAAGVHVVLQQEATAVQKEGDAVRVCLRSIDGSATTSLVAQQVFNCTYAGLNLIDGPHGRSHARLKHEITEMALIQLPPALEGMGITVMDGPFFSVMPFPTRQSSTLSHVRYTPHTAWTDTPERNPYTELEAHARSSRIDRMLRDAARYLPSICKASYQQSLFEVKTVLMKNEGDDGRPILFESYPELPGYATILGGKLDNIYDVLGHLDTLTFRRCP
ncbi:TPA: FAD-binding oxidoreductase [Stenotrophomonas maltophilia]|nr:FAD-binding oxidoreductase [Stenotrophomonas maltophilia]MBO1742251.1 FAD-binding oxidoreductase [Stenotrophomonas maltophilia]MCU1176355.1 FAD-binding oxidoreductase [Stenotrophomonas maltophilia]HEA4093746.1 FAD-binding oxidoreductase [Stenotrophomonas maltophilia]HEA4094768.1 FAD-binding oxidoreductase [Stenotrophomonas maltophilia]